MPDKVALELASQISNQNLSKEGWTTYYVDGVNGNDGANGLTWSSAFATVQYAIDVAESWAKIYIRAATYVENIIIGKPGISIIGERRDTVIISPVTGDAITITAENVSIERLKTYPNEIYKYGINITGNECSITNINFDGVENARGLIFTTNNVMISNIYSASSLGHIIICQAASYNSEINSSYFKSDYFAAIAISISGSAHNHIIKNNTFENVNIGIFVIVGSTNNNAYHNNFVNTTLPIQNAANTIFANENYYSTHTIDSNNDGITDTIFALHNEYDNTPIATRNGWNREAIGFNRAYNSVAIHNIYPTLAPAIIITSSAIAWTLGNYTEIVPVNTISSDFYATGIVLNNLVINSEYEINIATGLAAAESVIATVTHETNDSNLSTVISISPPILISANSRISARAATENAAADTCTIKLMYKI